MKRLQALLIFTALLAASAVPSSAAKKVREWRSGTVVGITNESTQRRNPLFGDQENIELWTFKVSADGGYYTVRQLARPNGTPITNTEGTTIQFFVQGKSFVVLLSNGREFALQIIKFGAN